MNVRLATFCVLGMALSLAGCGPANDATERPESARAFPEPDRPVSEVGSNQFSTEDQRDSRGEAQTVMDLAEIEPGMTVADIGAGNGYYTVRLAERVGDDGRVLAQIASCDQADADQAVASARATFDSGVWSRSAPAKRKRILQRFADLIDAHCEELALLESLMANIDDLGRPRPEASDED